MTNQSAPEPGVTGTSETIVDTHNTAMTMGSGDLEVFATPAMAALMESAAVRSLQGHLSPGETSVGVRLDVAHLAATPVGMRVRAEAVLMQVEGRRLIFEVSAYDDKDKIGEGRHERFVVPRDRFFSKVQGKQGTA